MRVRICRLWEYPCVYISAVCMRKRHLQCKITLNFQYSTYSYMKTPQMQPSCFVLGTSPRVATLVRQFCTSDLEKGNDSREGARDIQRAIIEIQAKDGSILNAIGQVYVCMVLLHFLLNKPPSLYLLLVFFYYPNYCDYIILIKCLLY